MKKIKKFFILFTMLVAGLSFKGADATNKVEVADAAESGSYAYLSNQWQSDINNTLSEQGVDVARFKTILITKDGSKVTSSDNLVGKVDVDTNTQESIINAYVYKNKTDETMFDCIIYADVETIYAESGRSLFYNLTNVENITFEDNFSVSQTNSFYQMFRNCNSLISIKGIEQWDTSSVNNMSYMFYSCYNLTTLNVSNFNTSNVTDMSGMFGWCKKIAALNVNNFNTSKVTNMNGMFSSCSSLLTLDVSHFDTSNVTDMNGMFSTCSSLTTLNVSNFKTAKVTSMNGMFGWCKSLTTIIGLDKFDTSNVTNMGWMFYASSSLTELNLSSFDTKKVNDFSNMFAVCEGLKTLDLSSFELSAINPTTDAAKLNMMFSSLNSIEEMKAPKNLNGNTIYMPYSFGMTEIDPTMEGWTILQGSKEFNTLYNTLMKINVCTEYAQASDLQAMYDGLTSEEKDKLATLADDSGVILTDKLSYMVGYADFKANEATATAGTHLVLSAKTSQYLVIVIACLSLALISGYYFIQKRKYAK